MLIPDHLRVPRTAPLNPALPAEGFDDVAIPAAPADTHVVLRIAGQDSFATNLPHLVAHHADELGYGWGRGSRPEQRADLALNLLEVALRRAGHRGARRPLRQGSCYHEAWIGHGRLAERVLAVLPRAGCLLAYDALAAWALDIEAPLPVPGIPEASAA